MCVRISVLIPSLNRPTLQRAVDSCEGADEVLVDINEDGDYGYAARHRLMARAKGTNLMFLDDDDVYTDNAIEVMRAKIEEFPGRMLIAQMQYPASGGVLWHDRVIRHGNIGTPMLVVPNEPELLGEWREHAGPGSGAGDYHFAATCRFDRPVWVERVIALIRPE